MPLQRLGVVVHLLIDLVEQLPVRLFPGPAGVVLEELEAIRLHPGKLLVHTGRPVEEAVVVVQRLADEDLFQLAEFVVNMHFVGHSFLLYLLVYVLLSAGF